MDEIVDGTKTAIRVVELFYFLNWDVGKWMHGRIQSIVNKKMKIHTSVLVTFTDFMMFITILEVEI